MKPRMRARTGAMPLDLLVTKLRRARWGELAGRRWHGTRAILLALVEIARTSRQTRTGRIEATAWQLAGAAGGYSERWVRDCLQALEYAGIITWWRGGVSDGRPEASIFLVSRRALAALLAAARQSATQAEREHATATMQRLQAIRSGHVKSKSPRFRRSDHAELSASLPPHGEVSTGQTPPRQYEQPSLLALMTHAGQEEARTTAPPAPSPDDTGPPNPVYAHGAALVRAALAEARRPAHA